jgi:hypothetical protein
MAVAASFVLPGPPPEQPARLSVTGELTTADGNITFDGQAELRGRVEGSTVEGVRVVFQNESQTAFRTVPVGTLRATSENTSAWRQPIEITLAQRPARISVGYGSFNNADDRRLVTEDLVWRNNTLVPTDG